MKLLNDKVVVEADAERAGRPATLVDDGDVVSAKPAKRAKKGAAADDADAPLALGVTTSSETAAPPNASPLPTWSYDVEGGAAPSARPRPLSHRDGHDAASRRGAAAATRGIRPRTRSVRAPQVRRGAAARGVAAAARAQGGRGPGGKRPAAARPRETDDFRTHRRRRGRDARGVLRGVQGRDAARGGLLRQHREDLARRRGRRRRRRARAGTRTSNDLRGCHPASERACS